MDRLERREAEDRAFKQRLQQDPDSGRFTEPRSWWARTSDEVAAWFGNPDALRRRQRDEAVGDHSGKGPAATIDEDERIVAEVSRQLTNDRMLDASRVAVACKDRAVMLTGEVTTSADSARAESIAAACGGVDSVENRLTIA
ncbi:BON domain-containing protein [Caulobacter sp. KR2-114]|uniref:BON domain-containing protein n=1 Tax=Caulobacter sp. KR2-114 TaxID=3400912 RepID=UPI003C01970D